MPVPCLCFSSGSCDCDEFIYINASSWAGGERGKRGASSEGVCHAHVVMSPEQKLNNFKVDKGNYFARCQMCVRTSVWCPGDDDR